MQINNLHSWDVTPKEAAEIQLRLANDIQLEKFSGNVQKVCGTDISYDKKSDMLFAAALVFSYPGLELIETASAIRKASFPYVPGLLSYREIPPLIECFEKLQHVPDIILCDGQGIAHPRRLGLASHLGLFTGLPAIGCAKSRLTGSGNDPGNRKGDWSSLQDGDEEIGRILRTRDGIKPLYISVGHLCDIHTAIEVTLTCCVKYRLPEPTRLAHHEVNRIRLNYLSSGS